MAFPTATKKSAFIAGMSQFLLVMLLDHLKLRGVVPYDADSPELSLSVAAYFLVTAIVFVIALNRSTSTAFKPRVPSVCLPLLFTVWGRMLIWFLGAVAAGVMFAFVRFLMQ